MDTKKTRRNCNVLCLGNGTKKKNYILSNLLDCNASYVVIDFDGKLQKETESVLREREYHVKTIDLNTIKNDDLDIDSLRKKKTVIYIKLSSQDPTYYKSLMPNFLTQLLSELFRRVDEDRMGTMRFSPQHIRIFLDEFCSYGHIPNFEQFLAIMRPYNISCSIFVNDMRVLQNAYPKDSQYLLANCDSVVWLDGEHAYTEKERIEKKLPKEKIWNIRLRKSIPASINKKVKTLRSVEKLKKYNSSSVVCIRGCIPLIDEEEITLPSPKDC